MPFVKLDCGMLDSTLWFEREAREVFITALLMAEPYELTAPTPQIKVRTLENTGWMVPAGWYGFVPAAGVGIIHRARVEQEEGLNALEHLGAPEASSRSQDFEGRRLVRVDGGYIVLNWDKYRNRDYTTAERSRRYRERKASQRDVTKSQRDDVTKRDATRDITEAEAEAEGRDQKHGLPEPASRSSVNGKSDGHGKGARHVSDQKWTNGQGRHYGSSLVGNHARCFHAPAACARGLCVPQFLGLQWTQQLQGDGPGLPPDIIIGAFVTKALEAIPTGPIGDDPIKFWRAAWSARHGSQAPAPSEPARSTKASRTKAAFEQIAREEAARKTNA